MKFGDGRWPLRSSWVKFLDQICLPTIFADNHYGTVPKTVYTNWFFGQPLNIANTGGAISEYDISEAPISGSTNAAQPTSGQMLPFPWMLTTGNMMDMTGGMRN